jgi:hypothetical protein
MKKELVHINNVHNWCMLEIRTQKVITFIKIESTTQLQWIFFLNVMAFQQLIKNLNSSEMMFWHCFDISNFSFLKGRGFITLCARCGGYLHITLMYCQISYADDINGSVNKVNLYYFGAIYSKTFCQSQDLSIYLYILKSLFRGILRSNT